MQSCDTILKLYNMIKEVHKLRFREPAIQSEGFIHVSPTYVSGKFYNPLYFVQSPGLFIIEISFSQSQTVQGLSLTYGNHLKNFDLY